MITTTVSSKFQVVIPQEVREAMGLKAGDRLEVFPYRDRIEMVPIRSVRELRGRVRGLSSDQEAQP
jgi:AbrB family looped-hinge helix DNA binding protein